MNKLLLTMGLALVVALAGVSVADQAATTGEADGLYGCCCPYSAWAGTCPQVPGPFLRSFDNVCVILDEDGEFVDWCVDDPNGVYPYRGMTWEEKGLALGPVLGTELLDVADFLDFFCGYDWDRWLVDGD